MPHRIHPATEARRLCAAAIAAPASGQSVVVQVGPSSTTAIRAEGDRLTAFRIVRHGPVVLAASQAAAASANGTAAARVLRAAAEQVAERARVETLIGGTCPVVGKAEIARAVITLGSAGGSTATLEQVHAATGTLGVRWVEGRRLGQLDAWVEPMMIGAAVLGAILERLGAHEIVTEPETPVEGTLEPRRA